MVKTRNNAEADDGSADEFLSLYPCRTRRHHKLEQKANGYGSDDSGPGRYRPSRRRVVCSPDSTDDEEECLPRGRHRSSRRYREDRMRDDEVPSRHSKCNVEHRNDDMMNGAIRRSTRQRKLMYETFNQNLIDKHVQILGEVAMNDQELQRPKRKIQVLEDQGQQEDIIDMYTRVKRQRKQVKRDMYGVQVESKSESSRTRRTRRGSDEDGENDESTEGTMTEGDEEEQPQGKQYFLREHRPRVNLYEAPPIERVKKQKPKSIFGRDSSPCSRRRSTHNVYMSPAHRSPRFRKKRAAFNRSSSTSSSSSTEDSSEEEMRFERRKNKSMARSRNRCLPMNLTSEDMSTGALRDREKIGSSLADVDPMSIDRSVTFESVGGLGKHIRSLKEMVVFPLLYPEVFERFKIAPPRGVLFYGPPGTGKTLVARALANECSHGDRRVAFFMRKGADCLSKWVGESERQLRLLFDKAYQMRPSIIFFDEIDGLAPVRSSRQDQIHSSIVSTLLALMDGLDNRGEIVVIGATNRLDSIDPALRRPGRFDREFLFPLPTVEARRQILQIHTKQWNPKPSDAFLSELAEKCVGYCGADLKALCTEAALHALRRRYPQIYTSTEKLQLDVQSINVSSRDFHRGMQNLVPTAQRSVVSPGRALSQSIKTLLEAQLNQALQILQQTFPPALASLSSLDAPVSDSSNAVAATEADLDLYSDDDDTGPSIYESPHRQGRNQLNVNPVAPQQPYLTFASSATERPWTHRPKLLIAGRQHQGQSSHLAPAVLHSLENMPVHRLDLPSLYAVSSSTPEESCAQVFREARRTSPSIIYVPHLGQLWDVIGETVRATFTTLLQDLEPGCPVLLLATSEIPVIALPDELCSLFDAGSAEVMVMRNPTEEERRECFNDLLMNQATKAPASRKQAGMKRKKRSQRILENLPLAAPVPPRALTEREKSKLYEQEEATLRELRIFLRDVLNKLGRDRKFTIFWKPVDEEEVPDYYDIIKNPMDLSTMMSRIDLHKYMTPKQFLTDIDLICSNALEYNPDRDPSDRTIRHRACALRDTAHSIITAEMDPEFEKLTQEIFDARERRGETGSSSAPSYYFVKPRERPKPGEMHLDGYPTRYSRRVRGMDVDLEEAKETLQHSQEVEPQQAQETHQPILRTVTKYIYLGSKKKTKKNISPWCKKRRKPRKLVIQIDEDGNEILPEWYKNYLQQEAGESREKEGESMEESGEEEAHLEEEGKEGLESDGPTTETEPELSPPNAVSRWALRSKGPNSEDTTPKQEPVDGDESPSFIRRNSPRSTKSVYRKPVIEHEPEQSISEKNSNQTLNTAEVLDSTAVVPASSESECRSPRQTEAQEVSHSQGPPETPVTTKRVARLGGGEPDLETLEAQPNEDQPTSQSCSTEEPDTGPDEMIEEEAEQENQSPQQENQPCNPEPDSPVKPRVTRSQTKSVQTQRAIQILEEEPAVLIVDRSKLSQLLEKTVAATDGFTVEKIEKLYSSMTQCVYQHRQNFDKTKLIHDLEECLRRQLVR